MDTFEEFSELFDNDELEPWDKPKDMAKLYGDYQLAWSIAVDIMMQGGRNVEVPWSDPIMHALVMRRGRAAAVRLLGICLKEVEEWIAMETAKTVMGEPNAEQEDLSGIWNTTCAD